MPSACTSRLANITAIRTFDRMRHDRVLCTGQEPLRELLATAAGDGPDGIIYRRALEAGELTPSERLIRQQDLAVKIKQREDKRRAVNEINNHRAYRPTNIDMVRGLPLC